ncbi:MULTISPECIES: hypothetical protein [Niastella]|uniref:Lipoprotein SmpA/OmlA domain-containing protein n=1 Tax=Niastella soli TaxID=2821487 RepID=A0ABS3YN85_9BACT|nr:hypothetical protein [Niastella soli]MBO9199340.1 hypothetical protein [Niastella soli]
MGKFLLAILLSGLLLTACKKHKENEPTDKDSIEYFNANLKADMKYDDMVSLFGEPDGDRGSGIHIYFYTLSDGSSVYIGYVDKILYARHMSQAGQLLHNII